MTLPALASGLLAVVAVGVAVFGLRQIRRGWLAREHTSRLLRSSHWAPAVVVGREPGTVGSRVADLRLMVRFTDPGGDSLTRVADHPLRRVPLAPPLHRGRRVTVAYRSTPTSSVEILTPGSDGGAIGMITIGMAMFAGGVALLLFSGAMYLVWSFLASW